MLVVADDADTMVSIVSSVDAGDSDGIIEDAVDVDGIPSTTEVIEEDNSVRDSNSIDVDKDEDDDSIMLVVADNANTVVSVVSSDEAVNDAGILEDVVDVE